MNFIETAWAQADAPAQGGGSMLILLVVMFALMYFMIIRPQSKRAKEHSAMVAGLEKGDEVVTTGGVLGKIVGLDEQFLTLQVSANTEIKVQRHAIGAVMPKGTFKN